jgi:hypothetical protein
MQKRLRLLRRVRRVLISNHTDPFLFGLLLYGLQDSYKLLLTATGQAAAAHKLLRAAFGSRISGDGLWVLHHGVLLLDELDFKVRGVVGWFLSD